MVVILAAGKAAKKEYTPCIRLMSRRRPGGKRAAIECKVILARALREIIVKDHKADSVNTSF